MAKKDFRDSTVAAIIKGRNITEEVTGEDTEQVTEDVTEQDTGKVTGEVTEDIPHIKRKNHISTQGRKGHKKPRFDHAFDSERLKKLVYKEAERLDMSATNFINDVLWDYFDKKSGKR